MDADMQAIYLLRDNRTVAGEADLVRDHDLVRRTHTQGILSSPSLSKDELEAARFVYEGEAGGTRDAIRRHTMDMVLRPDEALTWQWSQTSPPKYHGPKDIMVWGQPAANATCNGLWEYRPDFTSGIWRAGAERVEGVLESADGLVPVPGDTGTIMWRMHCPYVFVGGKLEAEGTAAIFDVSWDGGSWTEAEGSLDTFFPADGPARYEYYVRCRLPVGARLTRLAIVNDTQMARLALPGMAVGENRFVYTDACLGTRAVRIVHSWAERSAARPPSPPPGPVYPVDEGDADGTDVAFQWLPPEEAGGESVVDYHFELSDRRDMKWPLSPNFTKLISRTQDCGKTQYTMPQEGLLTPGREHYWRVRARNAEGVWGPWSEVWRFTPRAPAPPLGVSLELDAETHMGVLRWQPGACGRRPVSYLVYGSNEKGFAVSDEPYRLSVGEGEARHSLSVAASFVAETAGTELEVLGTSLALPNVNSAYYRVVAVDAEGNRSGPSDYACAPRPLIVSTPATVAHVGKPYRYETQTTRSRGDLRLRAVDGEPTPGFWDAEAPRFFLETGPD